MKQAALCFFTNITIKGFGPIIKVKNGKFKREIYADMGHHKYLIDEIVKDPKFFKYINPSITHNATAYINGIISPKSLRYNKLVLKEIEPYQPKNIEQQNF